MPVSSEDKENFDKMRKLAQEIGDADIDFGSDHARIMELYRLASRYDYMRSDAQMMRHHLDRYESLKQHVKKQAALSRVRDYVRKLAGLASMRKDDGN